MIAKIYTPPTIPTKFLIISDTHARNASLEYLSTERADVAIHCGDLTTNSKLSEFKSAIELLSKLDAPLKLVIAGDHDFTLDAPTFEIVQAELENTMDSTGFRFMSHEYGTIGDSRKLFEEATENGIMLLDQGTHHFVLDNGASLTVYASPYTSALNPGNGGFQYPRYQSHKFCIPTVDLVMTHGPPKGILDRTQDQVHAGCPDLFAAVAGVRPRMHCFGHVPDQWGGKLVSWRKGSPTREPCYFADVDHDQSVNIRKLAISEPDGYDVCDGFFRTSHCSEDKFPVEWGRQTLFVNAAVESSNGREEPVWVVDIELSKAF